MEQTIAKKNLALRSAALLMLMILLGLFTWQKSLAQTPFTITYTGLVSNTAAAPSPANLFTVALTNTTAYNGVDNTCSTSSDGQTTYTTVITAKAGFNFTITSVSGTGYASSAGRKGYQVRISSSNNNFTTANSSVTCIGTSSNCGGTGSIGSLTGSFTTTAGNSCTINVFKSICGGESGGGYSKTRTLVIQGTYTAAVTVPTATTSAATAITATGAALNGSINTNGASTTVTFNYGVTTSYGSNATAAQSPVASGTASVSAPVTSLSPNTQYNFRVSANNAAGTANGNNLTFYTLANLPVAPIVNNPGLNSLDVTAGSGDGNPTGTQYAIQEAGGQYVQANGLLGATAVFQTAAVWGTTTVTGLTSSATYTFKVKARNNANTPVETAFGTIASGTTLTPDIPIAALSASPALSEISLDGGQINITLQNVM